jgi:prefoldin subunit 5
MRKKFFSEFAQDEESKSMQIKAIDTQISALTGTFNDINSSVASLNDSISIKQISMMLSQSQEADKTKAECIMPYLQS